MCISKKSGASTRFLKSCGQLKLPKWEPPAGIGRLDISVNRRKSLFSVVKWFIGKGND